jgi:hypothetical protein
MKMKSVLLSLGLVILSPAAFACSGETVIYSSGYSTVKTVCNNGGTYFVPGGSGGSCSTVMIPGKGAVLLCE